MCGNEQVFGVDYNLTFAAVMYMVTVKLILVLSRSWNVPARHEIAPNAYVKANKEQDLDIFMKVPRGMQVTKKELQGFSVQSFGEVALHLRNHYTDYSKRSDSGEKFEFQVNREWLQAVYNGLCLYYKHEGKEWTIIGVYVDDLLVTGT